MIEHGVGAGVVADALRSGDIDALLELADLLEASGAKEKARSFVLQVICELLSENSQEGMLVGRQAQRQSNVIDLYARKPHD